MNAPFTVRMFDKVLDYLKKDHLSDFFERNEVWLKKVGLFGLYFAGIMGLIDALVLIVKYDDMGSAAKKTLAIGGLVWLFGAIVLHYIAYKFLPVSRMLIDSTPTKLGSRACLDSTALILTFTAILSFLGGIFIAIKAETLTPFITGFFIFIFCEYCASICMKPELVNVQIDASNRPGEELLGLFALVMKSFLRFIPITFGSGVLFGCIELVMVPFHKFEYTGEIVASATSIAQLLSAAALPLVGYFIFLSYYFAADLCMALLVLPGKVDRLKAVEPAPSPVKASPEGA